MKIGIIGGGNVGGNLARLALASGHEVKVGLRDPAAKGDLPYAVGTIAEAADGAEITILALPYGAVADALAPLAGSLRGKTVIDATNALNPDYSPMDLGKDTSAAEIIAGLLPGAHVVKAFNALFADNMTPERVGSDGQRLAVFLAGDDPDAVARVAGFVESLGLLAVPRHALSAARHIEAMAHLLISLAFAEGLGTAAGFRFRTA